MKLQYEKSSTANEIATQVRTADCTAAATASCESLSPLVMSACGAKAKLRIKRFSPSTSMTMVKSGTSKKSETSGAVINTEMRRMAVTAQRSVIADEIDSSTRVSL